VTPSSPIVLRPRANHDPWFRSTSCNTTPRYGAGVKVARLRDHGRMARTGPDRDASVALWLVALFLLAALVWLQALYAG
jgi:hypothetical protein